MASRIKNKEYNVRIVFDQDGEVVIGFVQGFYKAGSNCVDIKPVPESTISLIARKLGIKRSSNSFAINRSIREENEEERTDGSGQISII